MSAADSVLLSSSLEKAIPALEGRAEVWGRSWWVWALGSFWESPHALCGSVDKHFPPLLRSELQFTLNVVVALSRQARFPFCCF